MFPSRISMFCSILCFSFLFFAVDSSRQNINYPTIVVDVNGGGNFRTIQEAIDSVTFQNKDWICIYIKQGIYREKITIPLDKQFIYLKGDGKRKTHIVWDSHDSIATSATFTSLADNIVVKSITFVNSYNSGPGSSGRPMKFALAAMIQGDKSAFFRCGFIGMQDTLWDVQGRHYFKLCSIQGAVDFIFGAGQSLYESCTISVVSAALHGAPGYITAQGRDDPNQTNGFVFNDCNIVGNGKTYLGRPWRDYARVLFFNSSMSDIIVSQGWDAWYTAGKENQLTFAEQGCRGLGSDVSGRVKWASKVSSEDLQLLTSKAFIDTDGWTSKLQFFPLKMLVK